MDSVFINTTNVSNIDWSLWPSMKEKLSNHAVFAFVSDVLMYAPISEKEKQGITIETAKSVCYYHKLLKVQSDVLNILKLSGIKAVVL